MTFPGAGRTTFSRDPGNPDDPSTYPAPTNYSAVLGDPSYAIKNATYGVFFKDDWAVSSRVTLNLGVPLRRRDRNRQHRLGEPGSSRAKRRATTTTSHLASDSPTISAATDAPSFAAATAATTTRCCSTSRATSAGRSCSSSRTTTVLNPSYTNPLNGLTFEQLKAQNLPRNMIAIANDYRTPTADQLTIGVAHQFGPSYAVPNGLCSFGGLQRTARAQHQLLRGSSDAPAEGSANLRSPESSVRQRHALRDVGEFGLRRLAVRVSSTQLRP